MDFFKKAQELVKPAGGGASGEGGITQFASSFLSSETKPAAPAPVQAPADGAPPPAASLDSNPSYKELFSSVQVVYQAASGKDKVDYGVLAGAGSDLLEGLAAHTKVDEGAYGSYFKQAEGYLDSYHQSHTAPPPAPVVAPAPEAPRAPEAPPASEVHPAPEAHPVSEAPPAPEAHPATPAEVPPPAPQ